LLAAAVEALGAPAEREVRAEPGDGEWIPEMMRQEREGMADPDGRAAKEVRAAEAAGEQRAESTS